ncbi:MAG: hypothetical protein CLLPBCKN_003137 [Chroococcidiopsis cubana SAG 39.79]|jgi:hypothetical protein|uniref:HTH LytTR-type domain-containing protein n=1 Tax=Chroococcidiopsis cubana SAG 39.79 TaxID=388085 RepID=A0AB37UQB7_9CYAN|nr:hypothetical protein [Chroococcidiopsis cubana]MDZ4873741.1 hypothetical protein [Chroococcidiopsis cubana SAG 39.79]PSB65800.1 hypothetical protein C7B79_03775 [Chroococcidiopsis cubana CCALA 043]RUT13583.1 hypothetical protein DSM107010_12060 [Chroococcidiopsis cubana SAG 39.79]
MNLTRLKWTKNVKNQDGRYWAYKDKTEYIEPAENIFGLNWKYNQYENTCKPQKDDFIILRQHARVTHVVRVIDNELYKELTAKEFSFYRMVKTVWIANDGTIRQLTSKFSVKKSFFREMEKLST